MHNHIEDVNGKRKSTKGTRTEWLKTPGKDGLCFGERIEDLIKDSGKNAAQISDETGIAPSTLSDFVNLRDRAPDAKTIRVLAQYFGVSTDYLFGLTPAHSPQMNIKTIEEYTGLSAVTIEALHSFPCTSLQSNFLRRFFEDLLLGAEIAEAVPKAMKKYVVAEKKARWERQSLVKRKENLEGITIAGEEGYLISAADAAELFYGDAVSVAHSAVENTLAQMCEEMLKPYRIAPPDIEKLEQYRWEIYSEGDL